MPKDIQKINYDKIIITSTYYAEISEQLKEMGIVDYDVIRLGALRDNISKEDFHRNVMSKGDANVYLRELIFSNKPCFVGRLVFHPLINSTF